MSDNPWRLIGTAPKDGTPIIGWCPASLGVPDPGSATKLVDVDGPYVLRWHTINGEGWHEAEGEGYERFFPTHWRPVFDLGAPG